MTQRLRADLDCASDNPCQTPRAVQLKCWNVFARLTQSPQGGRGADGGVRLSKNFKDVTAYR
jgi:hypothetical protein